MDGHYDLWTVLLSFLIASLSGYVAFESIDHTRYSARPGRWTAVSGLTLGLGIWSTHFIGMLAWHPSFPLYYALGPTVTSVFVAVAASWLAMHLTTRTSTNTTAGTRFSGALVVGSGICAMHYIGMSALRFSAPMMWNAWWVAASVLIAVAAAWGAMALLNRTQSQISTIQVQIGAALAVGAAICGMHYAGMYAMMPAPGSFCLQTPLSFSGAVLARIGVTNALLFTLGQLIVSSHDKTRLVRMASDARFQAQEAARNVERLAAAGKIAASIAHEINNPLEAVTNLLYLMQIGSIGETERGYLAVAQGELKRIAEITTHTLKFYRQQGGPEKISIADLFESALLLFQKRIEASSIRVEKHWAADLPQITCRAGEIRQVLANLVNNAIDAMNSGGVLRLVLSPVADGLEIEVTDTGKGISPEMRAKILEPFFTTKGAGGTGLGLSITAEIVERHGGKLNFTSSIQPGFSGTTFLILLPFDCSLATAPDLRLANTLLASATSVVHAHALGAR